MYSKAENAVIGYLKQGMNNKDIADKLCVCEKTVKFHLTHIYAKAGVKSRAEFIAKDGGTYFSPAIRTEIEESFVPKKESTMLESGAKPVNPNGLQQGARTVQVVQKSQEEKVQFINETFKVSDAIEHMHKLMKNVTAQELTPNTVNAACNCVARINETINTAIQAAKFLNER
jgi:hypothetical protein